MTSKEINNRIEILRKQLNQANKEYYIEETPSLSDFEYDKKFFELLDLEKNNTDLGIESIKTSGTLKALRK